MDTEKKDIGIHNYMLIASLAEGFVTAWACVRACHLHGMSIMGVIWFVLISYFFMQVRQNDEKNIEKKNRIIACVLAALLTVLYVITEKTTLTDGLENRLFIFVVIVVCIAGFFLLLYHLILFLFRIAAPKKKEEREGSKKKHEKLRRYFPCITFLSCMLVWMPWFLYSYPGIMTPDSINQLEQVQHLIPYANANPMMHTLFIALFYKLGFAVSGSANGGVACYVLFQMAFRAFAAAFLVRTIMEEREDSLCAPFLVTCFYALMPYHAVLSVIVWKDGMFAAAVLLFSTQLYRLMRKEKATWQETLEYALMAVAFCLLRSNGWYAFLMLMPFLLFAFRKNKKIWYPLHIAVLLTVLVIKGPVMGYCGIEQPDFVESLCIPIQQMARVLVDERELTAEERNLIEKVIDTTYIKELYAADFADNMKELVRAGNQQYLTEHKAEYAKLYLKLMFRYPDEYFKAYVDQTYGYYDPNADYPVADAENIIDNRCGVFWAPIISSGGIIKIREILIKLQNIVPVYGSLWNIGAVLWFSLILLGISMANADKIKEIHLMPFLPALAVIGTVLIATPVAADFRYAYSLFYTLPLMGYAALKE